VAHLARFQYVNFFLRSTISGFLCLLPLSSYAYYGWIWPSTPPSNNLCLKAERVIFACNTGKKSISVCASMELSPTSGYMHYRYGSKKQPEKMIVSGRGENDKPSGFTAQDGRDITSISLEFGSDDEKYYVDYNRIVNRVDAVARSARFDDGVNFFRGNVKLKQIKCSSPAYIHTSDWHFFDEAGIKELE